MDLDSWAGSIDLATPAGVLLRRLAAALPKDPEFVLTVFGSAPIQIQLDATLTITDVALFADADDLSSQVDRAGLGPNPSSFYVQVGNELNFRTSPRWRSRVKTLRIDNCLLVFPHPIDVLIAKLTRLEEKDMEAFRVVRRKTGHPSEAELIEELSRAVDLFRPGFEEEQSRDLAGNCRRLWPAIYGREIDPRKEIVAPALLRRREGYGAPCRDYKSELRDAASPDLS